MYILYEFDKDMIDKTIIGGDASKAFVIDYAQKLAEDLKQMQAVKGVAMGKIYTYETSSGNTNIVYKSGDDMILKLWVVRHIKDLA